MPGCVLDCPGCKFRFLSQEESDFKKKEWVKKNLNLEKITLSSPEKRVAYRKKVILHARKQNNAWNFGLVKRIAREELFIPIPNCPVHDAKINIALEFLQKKLPLDLPLHFIAISGESLTYILKTHREEKWEQLLSFLVPSMKSMWINWNPSAGRRVFSSRHWSHLLGEKWLGEGLVHGPSGFLQQIPELENYALDLARKFLEKSDLSLVLDLYSGLGLSLRLWTSLAWRTLGIELNGESYEASLLNAPKAMVLKGRVEERLPQIKDFLLSEDYLLYTNPPRTGHSSIILDFLSENLPKKMAYLSCNAKTLASDIRGMPGMKLVDARAFDFFPQTDHVEVLALLERR